MVTEGFVLAVDHRGCESVIDNNLASALFATSVSICIDGHRFRSFGIPFCLLDRLECLMNGHTLVEIPATLNLEASNPSQRILGPSRPDRGYTSFVLLLIWS